MIIVLRYGIISATTPGMAAEDASDGEIQAFEGAVLAEGLKGILRAGGGETAAGLLEGGDADLIESDQEYERCDRYLAYHILNSALAHLPLVCCFD